MLKSFLIAYHSHNEAGADIGEVVQSSGRIVLAKSTQEVRKGQEARDLSSIVAKASEMSASEPYAWCPVTNMNPPIEIRIAIDSDSKVTLRSGE